jgi:hypothetical protein
MHGIVSPFPDPVKSQAAADAVRASLTDAYAEGRIIA